MEGRDDESPFEMEKMYTPIIKDKMEKLKSQHKLTKTVLVESQDQKLVFYQSQDPMASCAIKMELEQTGSNGMPWSRTLLSTLENTQRLGLTENTFLRVGYGDLAWIPVIEDGDVQGYPTAVIYSSNQTCTIVQDPQGNTNITSTVQLPCRNNFTSTCTDELQFLTQFLFNKKDDKGNSYVQVITQYQDTGANVDFDFIETTFDSP